MDKFKRSQIRSLLQDDRFRSMEFIKNIIIAAYQSENVKADDEFNTIWRTAQKEAKIEGLNDFFNKLIEEASKE